MKFKASIVANLTGAGALLLSIVGVFGIRAVVVGWACIVLGIALALWGTWERADGV